MTGLMILIVILLIAVVAWMVCMTLLFLQERNDIKTLGEASDTTWKTFAENQKELFEQLMTYTGEVSAEVAAYKDSLAKHVEQHNKETKFALDTIQEARRIKARTELQNSIGFYTGKEEDDTKEPRS